MPLYAAGQKIRGNEINSLPQIYRVTTPQICSNSTTFRDVAGLAFAADANTWYLAECMLAYHAKAANKIKFNWVMPTGTTLGWWGTHGVVTSGVVSGDLDAGIVGDNWGSTGQARSGDDVNALWVFMTASVLIGANAGTAKLQFAQNSAVVHDTTIRTGSAMRVTRMS